MPRNTSVDRTGSGQNKSGRTTPADQNPKWTDGPLDAPVARRAFLAGSFAAAAGAAYAALASAGGDETAKEETSADFRRLSYRETEHIRQFYARARF